MLLTIIVPLHCNAQPLTQKQEEVWHILEQYKIYTSKLKINDIRTFSYEDFQHPLIKARLLEELQDHTFTQEEIDSWVNQPVGRFDSLRAANEAKKFIKYKQPKGDYKLLFDSLMISFITERKADRIEALKKTFTQVHPSIILTCGWLDMQEAVPILQAALQDSLHYNTRVVKVALARLQVEPYYTEMIEETRNYKPELSRFDPPSTLREINLNNAYVLIYIATQESIAAISSLFDWPEMYQINPHDQMLYPIGTLTLLRLFDLFEEDNSFRQIFPKQYLFLKSSLSKVYVNEIGFGDVKKWLLDNKGQYRFDRYDFRLVPFTVY